LLAVVQYFCTDYERECHVNDVSRLHAFGEKVGEKIFFVHVVHEKDRHGQAERHGTNRNAAVHKKKSGIQHSRPMRRGIKYKKIPS
jgi:hypothetical protein